MPTIEVPGHGLVEFPDNMSDAEIVKAIERDLSPVSDAGPFGRAVGRAWEGQKGFGLEAGPALVADALGFDEYRDRKLEEYADREARTQRVYPADVPSFTDIKGLGDAGTYVIEAVGESLVSMGPSLLAGGAGGLAGKYLATRAAQNIVENAIKKGATREAAETAVARAASKATFRGAAVGAGTASLAQNIPETYAEATGGTEPGLAIAAGTLKSAFDLVPQMRLLGNLFGREVAEKALLKRIGKEAAKNFGLEGATEAAQESTDLAVENYLDRNPELFSQDNLIRALDAGLKGGIGGGVAGGASAVFQRSPRDPLTPQEDAQRPITLDHQQAVEVLTNFGQDPANFSNPIATAEKILGTSIQRSIERQSAADETYLENLAKLQKSKVWRNSSPMQKLELIENPRRSIEQETDGDGERPTRATAPETTGDEEFIGTPQGPIKRDDSFAGQLGQAVNAPTGSGRYRVQRVDDDGQPVLIIVDTQGKGDDRIAKQARLEKGQDLTALLKKFEDDAKYRNEKDEEFKKQTAHVGVDPITTPMTPQETEVADTFGFNSFKSRTGKSAAQVKDALAQMAKLFSVPADALGLGGALSFEVKQPSHNILGDFNPRDKKMRGDNESTVVHEWVHAIDNHFNKLYGRDGKNYIKGVDLPADWGLLTAGEIKKIGEDAARPELEVAWHNLMAALNGAKNFNKDAKSLGGGYWSSPWERLARAAQAYMGQKAGEHTPLGKYHRGYSKANPKLFPHDAELEKIGGALENFFAVMKERPKQTARGTPATELYRLGELGSDAVADLRKIVRDAAREVLGPELSKRVKMVDQLDRADDAARVAAEGQDGHAIGRYTPSERLIEIALNQPSGQVSNTVFHEAFHMLEDMGLFGYEEAMVLERDAGALKSFLSMAIKQLGWEGLDVNAIAGIPQELRAYSFEAYTALRNKNAATPGLTGALRRLLEKGYQFIRKLANGLRKHGSFQSYANVFDKVASGEVASRKAAKDSGEFTGFYLRQDAQALDRTAATMADDVKAALQGDKGDPVNFAADIGIFEKIFNHPTFLADKYPALRPLVDALGKIRSVRSKMLHGMQESFRPFLELPADGRLRVETVADLFNQAKTEPRMVGDQVVAPDGTILKGREAAALMGIRQALNSQWDQYLEAMKRSLGDDLDPSLLAELQRRKNSGYLPQMRFGKIGFRVVDKPSGDVVWFQTIEPSNVPGQMGRNITQRRINAIRSRLKKERFGDANFDVEPAFELTKDSWKDKNILDAVGLVEATMMAFNLGKDTDTAAVLDDIQKQLKKKGFKAHLADRKNIPGYINDENRGSYLSQALPTYAARSSHYIAREMHSPELREAAKATKGLPKLKRYAEDLVSYSHSPNEEQQFLKNLSFHWLLGANVSSAAINLTQVMHATLPYLSMYAGPARAAKEVGRAFKDAVSIVNIMMVPEGGIDWSKRVPGITDEERKAMQAAHEEGLLFPVNTQELTGLAQRDYGSFVPTIGVKGVKTMEYLMHAFNTVENINRVTTWLATRRMAADPAVRAKADKILSKTRWAGEEKTPDLLARAAVEDTQFVMGRENRPEFMRGMMALPTQFMSFPVQMFEQWIKAAKYYGGDGVFSTGPGKTMLALMALGVMATAGVWGLPFAEPTKKAVEAIYKMLTGQRLDVDKEMREAIVEAGLDKQWGEAISKGLGRLAGIDISKRTSLDIIPTNLFSGNVRDMMGPTGAVTLGSLADAHERFKQGQNLLGFAALMPTFLKNIITARENLRQGVITGQGNVLIPPGQVGAGQALTKGVLGFTPAPEAQARELVAARQGLTEGVKDLRESYTDRLVKARREAQLSSGRGDQDGFKAAMTEFQRLMTETREHDRKRRPEERLNINVKTVGDRVKRDLAGLASKDNVKKMAKNARGAAKELSNIYPGGSK